MKNTLFILILTIAGFVSAIDNFDQHSCPDTHQPSVLEGNDGYEINLIHVIHGLEYEFFNLDFIEPDELLVRTWDEIVLISAYNGAFIDIWDFAGGNGNPHGLSDVNSHIHVNDGYDTVIYEYDGSIWTTYENPCSNEGEGMDYDGSYIWELTSGGYVYKFDTNGVLNDSWQLPADTHILSGMTLFPSGSNQGIAIICRYQGDDYLSLFEVTGSTLTYLGVADLQDKLASYGLTYSESRGTFFWSWLHETPGAPYYGISELELIQTGLEQTTWGAVKTSF